MNGIDPAEAIDVASKALAAVVSLLGLVVAVGQGTRPAVLKRRVKWLLETIEHEQNEARLATLSGMLRNANASLVAGLLVPGWRFLPLVAWMLLGPAQAFAWAQKDADIWNILGALGVSIVLSATPIRRGVRLLAERYRVAHEYREGAEPVRRARLGQLNQMEGGTRAEFAFGLAGGLGINAIAVGVALAYLDLVGWGVAVGLAGAALTVVIAVVIHGYARKRVGIFGPWSVGEAQAHY